MAEMNIEQQRALALARARRRRSETQSLPEDVNPDSAVGMFIRRAKGELPPEGVAPADTPKELYDTPIDAKPVPSLDEKLGLTDYKERGAILPFGVTEDGKTELALPQVAVDIAKSVLLPGHVAKGGSYSPEDVTKMALDTAIPATGSIGGKAASSLSRREFVEDAPTVQNLKARAVAAKDSALATGQRVDPDDYADFLGDMENTLVKSKVDKRINSRVWDAFDAISKDVGESPDVGDLINLRRNLATAAKSPNPDDRMFGERMLDQFDHMVETFSAGKDLGKFRRNWFQAKKLERIETAMERAALSASGMENGLRTEFRAILKNPSKKRGFTPAELEQMRRIVKGTALTNTLRIISKLSFGRGGGSNFLGGSIGMAGGGAVGGPIGALAAPAAGRAGYNALESQQVKIAEMLKAMAARGEAPPKRTGPGAARAVVAPLVGTQVEEQ